MPVVAKSLACLFRESGPIVAAGAHDALSARLVAAAGFDAVWASGFGISAVRAVPDASILTMSETLEAVRAMSDATPIPVIADCDTGFGNAINVMRTVTEFERAGVAAISLEDNVFPKRCSFYPGVTRDLVPIEEHARKIAAAKSARSSPEFLVIARTEALIAGWGREHALGRARAYAEAGADAILIHSKQPDLRELAEVAQGWELPTPLVAVPTTYVGASLGELTAAGFKLIIYANQALRAAVSAMRDALRALREGEAAQLEQRVAPLEDIYSLVGVDDLQENEARFLLPRGHESPALVRAANEGHANGERIRDRGKNVLGIESPAALERPLRTLNASGINDVAVVRGYRKGRS